MIDITKAQANQTTINGVNQDWIVTLNGEEIYTLPAKMSPEETFQIRDSIGKMMDIAALEMKKRCDEEKKRIIERGDFILDNLKSENERLSKALERLMLGTEVV